MAEPDQSHHSLITLRRKLHQHPELGFEERVTRQILIEALEAEELEVRGPVAETGFYVDIQGDHPGPVIAYRADMDGLPIADEKQVAYASTHTGKGHMCGHDVHSTIAFGVARYLSRNRDKICGTVRVFWQPAEEPNPSGAPEVIKSGILDECKAIYGIHCDPSLSAGSVCILSGMVTASFDKFEITLTAPESLHSARPHQGTDTIWVANKVISELYGLPGRLTNSLDPCVIAVSMIRGGETHNVIPKKISFAGTIRCSKHEDREVILDHINRLLNSFAEIYNITCDMQLGRGAPPVRNDDRFAVAAREVAAQNQKISLVSCSPSMGGEDFAHYSLKLPALFLRVGTSSGPSTSHPVHTPLFDVDESVMEPASELLYDILIQNLSTISSQ